MTATPRGPTATPSSAASARSPGRCGARRAWSRAAVGRPQPHGERGGPLAAADWRSSSRGSCGAGDAHVAAAAERWQPWQPSVRAGTDAARRAVAAVGVRQRRGRRPVASGGSDRSNGSSVWNRCQDCGRGCMATGGTRLTQCSTNAAQKAVASRARRSQQAGSGAVGCALPPFLREQWLARGGGALILPKRHPTACCR